MERVDFPAASWPYVPPRCRFCDRPATGARLSKDGRLAIETCGASDCEREAALELRLPITRIYDDDWLRENFPHHVDCGGEG